MNYIPVYTLLISDKRTRPFVGTFWVSNIFKAVRCRKNKELVTGFIVQLVFLFYSKVSVPNFLEIMTCSYYHTLTSGLCIGQPTYAHFDWRQVVNGANLYHYAVSLGNCGLGDNFGHLRLALINFQSATKLYTLELFNNIFT